MIFNFCHPEERRIYPRSPNYYVTVLLHNRCFVPQHDKGFFGEISH